MDREKYMDQAEVERLRTVTEARAITDLQSARRQGVVAWAIVDTALMTGLRVSEIQRLKVGDFDPQRGSLSVTRAKKTHPKPETLAIPTELTKHLREFIKWKGLADEPTGNTAPLFVGKRGPLTCQGLQQIWHKAIKKAGLPKELSIHCARHTLATHLLKATKNLRQVQKQLGHSSPAVTANMYADVSFEDMQEGVNGVYNKT